MSVPSSERTVALLEAAKGLLVLIAGVGVLGLIHRDLQAAAAGLIAHLHLNPANRYPRIFLLVAGKMTEPRLVMLAAGAAGYAIMRFVESYGIWRGARWAAWLATVSAAIYVPFELESLVVHREALAVPALLVNLVVVAVMLRALRNGPRRATEQPGAR